jgi:hypothetical protein
MQSIGLVQPYVNEERVPMADVVGWTEKQTEKGDMGGSGGRLRVTALRQMAEQVAVDEPDDARWVLANIERLADRWARKNTGNKADTARTYASRAKTTIEEYLRWSAAPSAYDPKKPPARAERKPEPRKAVAAEAAPVVAATSVQQAPIPKAPANAVAELRSCPLGQGREPFRYSLPAEGLTVKDAMRIAYHLVTVCDDYDPSQSPIQVFSSAIERTR